MNEEISGLPEFITLSRQKFRRFFQPSRVVMAVLPQEYGIAPNIITLCFHMYCSYKPAMMAFAIQRGSLSFELLSSAKTCVLAVPGEDLVEEAMFCGTTTGRSVNKVQECNLALADSTYAETPGLAKAIANIEVKISACVPTGDHVMAIAEVLKFGVNASSRQKPLLSIGPDTAGYKLLLRKGIHRLAVVDESTVESWRPDNCNA